MKEVSVFILGYYGFGNWGDELSLQSIVEEFSSLEQKMGISFELLVLSRDDSLPFLASGLVKPVLRRNFAQLREAIGRCQVLLLGGGSLLQDATSFRSLLYYGFIIFWALARGKAVIFYRCGLGPFHRRISRQLVSYLLRRSALFIARDPETQSAAIELGMEREKVFLGSDPVFSFPQRHFSLQDRREKIALFLRPFNREKSEKWKTVIKELASFSGKKIELVAFHQDKDQDWVRELGRLTGCSWVSFSSWSEIGDYFQELDCLFTMRLHPAILATLFQIPWFGFDFDPKIVSFCRFWGGENLIPLAELSPRVLLDFYRKKEKIVIRSPQIRQTLVERGQQSHEILEEFWQEKLKDIG
ncbi:MAG: hypothetical protein PWP04_531 [Candidatus Atribacteria bacterium]|nr:hypothetical protein [Candidatus Atribacteria bacterium]